MFYPFAIGLVLFVVYLTARRHICDAVWCCWWFAAAMPTHSARHIHSLSVNLRLITCLALLAALVFAPRSQVPKLRLTLTDLLVAALLISFNISPLLAGEFVPLGCVDLMRIWVVPYVIGRIAGSSTESLNRVMPFVVSICLALSFAGVLEAVTRINVLNHLFNHWAFTEVRWGLRRASVNVAQPIPFGFMIVLMSPIGFEAARRARLGIGPSWWRYMPLIMGAGVFSSMSRAPQLAYLLTCSGVYFFRTPKMRVPVLAALLILAAGLLVFRDTTKQLLHRAAPHEYHATIRIDGKPYHYSGTLHRELLFVVYKDSLLRAGWFGYGDRELSEIPYQKTVVGMNFWSIDDHYIWYVLRKGWLGVALFLLLGLTGSYNLARLALQLDAPGSMLAAAACSAILAVLLLLFTVLMIPAPGDVMLFWIGFGASWRGLKFAAAETERTFAPRPRAVRRRLVPGHLDPRTPDSRTLPPDRPETKPGDAKLPQPVKDS